MMQQSPSSTSPLGTRGISGGDIGFTGAIPPFATRSCIIVRTAHVHLFHCFLQRRVLVRARPLLFVGVINDGHNGSLESLSSPE